MSSLSSSVTAQWLGQLQANSAVNSQDDPSYYTGNPRSLITTSSILDFNIGTGEEVLESIFRTISLAHEEVLLVTCFWARSKSQEALSSALKELSNRAIQEGRKIQVRICFSSRSLLQKLWQTSSVLGEEYPPSSWESTLGLPSPNELQGLDLGIKSVFVRPLGVIHPKFVIVDRTRAIMPSCNISWEDWFEGGIELQGGIVKSLLQFWQEFWGRGDFSVPDLSSTYNDSSQPVSRDSASQCDTQTAPLLGKQPMAPISKTPLNLLDVPTILLPSPHHVNPKFRPFLPTCSAPPPTPLNLFLLSAFANAKRSIYVQTPNLTSPPAISALLEALQNGIDVRIVTSTKMMIVEQLLTAGTVTEMAVWDLQRRYSSHCRQCTVHSSGEAERGFKQPGHLSVSYYHPRTRNARGQEPVKSHLKLTVVDEELVVLGSGNMDRASWFTSQELGIAFFSESMASKIRDSVDTALEGRLDP